MTSRQRMSTALDRGVPDRLRVTTHRIMRSFTGIYRDGLSDREVFDRLRRDAGRWLMPLRGDGADVRNLDREAEETGQSAISPISTEEEERRVHHGRR